MFACWNSWNETSNNWFGDHETLARIGHSLKTCLGCEAHCPALRSCSRGIDPLKKQKQSTQQSAQVWSNWIKLAQIGAKNQRSLRLLHLLLNICAYFSYLFVFVQWGFCPKTKGCARKRWGTMDGCFPCHHDTMFETQTLNWGMWFQWCFLHLAGNWWSPG